MANGFEAAKYAFVASHQPKDSNFDQMDVHAWQSALLITLFTVRNGNLLGYAIRKQIIGEIILFAFRNKCEFICQ